MLFELYEEQEAYSTFLNYSQDHSWKVAEMAAKNHPDLLPSWANPEAADLPKSVIYHACVKIDGFDTRSLTFKHNFTFDEFTEPCGYYIFDDGSLYGYGGGDPEIWANYKDYAEEIVLSLDREKLQSADLALLNIYEN